MVSAGVSDRRVRRREEVIAFALGQRREMPIALGRQVLRNAKSLRVPMHSPERSGNVAVRNL